MGTSAYRGRVDSCVSCGAELGVGRFCLNCGHPIGSPAPAPAPTPDPPLPPTALVEPVEPVAPVALPVQAADPTPVAPTSPPDALRTPAPDVPAQRTDWDPREDLLPYEEVDDLDSEVPVRGWAWLGWVAGAALLLGLAFVLLRVLASDDVATEPTGEQTSSVTPPDASAEDEPTSAARSEGPRGVGPRTDFARGAGFSVPATAPPTTDLDGTLVAYEASQMGDGNPATTWRTAGDATGQTVTVTLPEPAVVTRVGLVNGYAKQVAGVDWYPNNRRILSVTWGFDDGTTVEQTFAERPGLQRLKVTPVQTGTVTLTITSVTPPGTGPLGRDYTAISEVAVIGRRAG